MDRTDSLESYRLSFSSLTSVSDGADAVEVELACKPSDPPVVLVALAGCCVLLRLDWADASNVPCCEGEAWTLCSSLCKY